MDGKEIMKIFKVAQGETLVEDAWYRTVILKILWLFFQKYGDQSVSEFNPHL